ncbi:antitoxin Xre/MbcA/ParS toxin-binding domain-containing protein [Pseudomonas sp. R81]|uniref:antitoxin Xre/MbcA/ParS toxin-binding domain-containing protein n=1 Tax=Pseudomonas sp. R81 TaxID=1144885 RepID=UPI00029B4A1A|nr:antitoxin Xre/MbcA/ParS toxin-binding domain-containing protein [Pseudomonas sp. R81]
MLIEFDLNMNDAETLLRHCTEHQPDSEDFRENARLKETLQTLAEALHDAMRPDPQRAESSEMIDPQLLEATVKLFGDSASAVSWLSRPLGALGQKRPRDVPTEEALALILRIEHGIVA